MKFELPNIKRCCFCIPLRYGLLAWAYFKLIWCLVLILTILFFIKVSNGPPHPVQYLIPLLYCASLLIEFIITIVFVVGAHKKNPKLLRVYYIYGMVVVGIIILICLLVLGLAVYEYFAKFMFVFILQNVYETSIFGGGVILFNVYLLALVRSEIFKLENNTQFSFQNNQSEPTCSMEKVDV